MSLRAHFEPKLLTAWREGYGLKDLRRDAIAGLTVAIVALPLAMALAIASGTTPEKGLHTAIIAGFLISALGGSRVQIGGPTGAFIPVVFAVIERHGYDGLLLATIMAGVMLLFAGWARLGLLMRYMPQPVITGFTAGIGVIIFSSQLRDLFGLQMDKVPAEFGPKMAALWEAAPTVNLAALGLALACIGLIVALRKLAPKWPGFLIAVVGGTLAALLLGLPVETIGSRFGELPSSLPEFTLPEVTLARLRALMPDAFTIAFLAGIESLLSAVVADGMTGQRHRSNAELVAQGAANIGSALFGGLPATGAIARTATNVRAGARSPVAGILHAVFVLVFMLALAPIMAYVPLAALAAVLVLVAWGMSEIERFRHLLHAPVGDRALLLITFGLTVMVDLTVAIEVGLVVAAFLFMHRMASTVEVEVEVAALHVLADLHRRVLVRQHAAVLGRLVDQRLRLDRHGDVGRVLVGGVELGEGDLLDQRLGERAARLLLVLVVGGDQRAVPALALPPDELRHPLPHVLAGRQRRHDLDRLVLELAVLLEVVALGRLAVVLVRDDLGRDLPTLDRANGRDLTAVQLEQELGGGVQRRCNGGGHDDLGRLYTTGAEPRRERLVACMVRSLTWKPSPRRPASPTRPQGQARVGKGESDHAAASPRARSSARWWSFR